MLDSLAVLLPFYVIIAVGVVAGRMPALARGAASINGFVFYVALPAFLFVTLAGSDLSAGIPWQFVIAILVTTAGIGLVWGALARLMPSIRRFGATSIGLAASYGNVSYFGIPIGLAILGPDAALAVGIGQLVHNVLFLTGYPLARAILHRGDDPSNARREIWLTLRRGLLTNPLVISVAAGLASAALFPGADNFITESIALIGQAAVPCALFAIGVTLIQAVPRLRSERGSMKAILFASVGKALVLPAVSFGIALALAGVMPYEWLATIVLLAAMPVSASAFVLAQHYEGDALIVTGSIALTSMAALLTVPAVAWTFGLLA